MKNFDGFGLSRDLNRSLSTMGYTIPTPIQAKAIPLAMQGLDILGSAQTGTGKTAAYSIPLIEALLRSPQGSALVLTPTRELAKQVLDVIHQLLGAQSPIKTAFIIGGESMGKQLSQLRANPRIIVGTPGRINDHLQRRSLSLKDAGFLVLDETDRMLDMGFGVQLDKILKYLPAKRQTLMFSATLPQSIIQLSGKYLTKPERVSIGATNVVALNIKQDIIRIEQDKKYNELLSQLHERTGSVIIFAKTKFGADRMAKNLRRDGFTSDALHGDLRQTKRDKVMHNFREKNFRILVATDIAARGLDVPHIEHVINFDLPQVAEDYIHRMGRTARAGAEGSALCFISPQDGRKWKAIEQLLDPTMKGSSMPNKNAAKKRGSGGKESFGRAPKKKNPFQRGQKNTERGERSDRPQRSNDGEGYKGKKTFGAGKTDNGSDKPNSSGKPENRNSKPEGRNGKPKDRNSRPEGRNGKPEGRNGKPENRNSGKPAKKHFGKSPNKQKMAA